MLKVEVKELKERLNSVALNAVNAHIYESATLTTASKDRFNVLRGNIGNIAVTLQDIKPLGNGSVVKLSIGNPTSADIKRFDLRATYGKQAEDGSITSPKVQERNFVSIIPAGTFTTIEIPLPDLAPQNLDVIILDKFVVQSFELRGTD